MSDIKKTPIKRKTATGTTTVTRRKKLVSTTATPPVKAAEPVHDPLAPADFRRDGWFYVHDQKGAESYGLQANRPYRVYDLYDGRVYVYNTQDHTTTYIHDSYCRGCVGPEAPKVGDSVIVDTYNSKRGIPAGIATYKVFKILAIEGTAKPQICRIDHPANPRQYLDAFMVVPKGYVEPKPEFEMGDLVVLPEEHEARWQSGVSNRGMNTLCRVTQVGVSDGKFRYTLNNSANGMAVINSWPIQDYGWVKAPKDWKPREIPVDLAALTLTNVHMTQPGFSNCCGAKIIYSFYGIGRNLIGADRLGRALPNIPITLEHIKAAILNSVRGARTGVFLSVLATDQIKQYGPMLEEIGFTKLNEYPNLNHGPNHMNALYGYFCHEQEQKQAVKETTRAFG